MMLVPLLRGIRETEGSDGVLAIPAKQCLVEVEARIQELCHVPERGCEGGILTACLLNTNSSVSIMINCLQLAL